MQRLYSAMRIGEALGVTRQYVSRYVKERCPDAKVGTKIDVEHSEIVSLFESKGVDPFSSLKSSDKRTSHLAKTDKVSQSRSSVKAKSKPQPRQARNTDDIGQVESIKNLPIDDHADLTIREIAAHFGSDEEYRGWLDARKKQVEIVERQIKVDERKGELISREFVSKAVFGLIEEFTSRLLVDSAVTIATKVFAHQESGDSIEEAIKTVRLEISKPLKAAKDRIKRNLKEVEHD